MLYLTYECENVLDPSLQILSVLWEGRADDLEFGMCIRLFNGNDAVAHLELFLRLRQLVRIDSPKGLKVGEYLVVLVRQPDVMCHDIVPPA